MKNLYPTAPQAKSYWHQQLEKSAQNTPTLLYMRHDLHRYHQQERATEKQCDEQVVEITKAKASLQQTERAKHQLYCKIEKIKLLKEHINMVS